MCECVCVYPPRRTIRKQVLLQTKLKFLSYLEPSHNWSKAATARHANVHIQTFNYRVKQDVKYKAAKRSSGNRIRVIGGGRPLISPELDQKLFEHFLLERRQGHPVHARFMRIEGLQLAADLPGLANFKAS